MLAQQETAKLQVRITLQQWRDLILADAPTFSFVDQADYSLIGCIAVNWLYCNKLCVC